MQALLGVDAGVKLRDNPMWIEDPPDVRYESSAGWNEVASYLVVCDGAMRYAQRSDVVPTERFHDDRLYIHQLEVVAVTEVRKAVATEHCVQLSLRLLLHLRMHGQGNYSSVYGRRGLNIIPS